MLESLLPAIGEGTGVGRIRVAYLQPAEVRSGLLQVIAQTDVVAPYYDLSFQHASPSVLRRMRRFGGREEFLGLIAQIRDLDPRAGVRSNIIVGFPGETQEDLDELSAFLVEARLDAVGVFGYSDEDGTEAVGLANKVDEEVIRERVETITALVEELMAQRAEDRIGEAVTVLIEIIERGDDGEWIAVGRAGHQGPDDGATVLVLEEASDVSVGEFIAAVVVDTDGVDLIAERS